MMKLDDIETKEINKLREKAVDSLLELEEALSRHDAILTMGKHGLSLSFNQIISQIEESKIKGV